MRTLAPAPWVAAVPAATHASQSLGRRRRRLVLRSLLQRRGEFLPLLASGLLGGVDGCTDGLLGDLRAPLDRLGCRGLCRLDRAVGHLAHPLVLDSRLRQQRADDEADREPAERQAERVAFGCIAYMRGAALERPPIGQRTRDRVFGAGQLRLDRFLLVVDVVLCPRADVGLVAERVDLVADPLPCLRYFRADDARVFAHSTSSFTVSMVCSGTGLPASATRSFPCFTSTYAIAASTAPTISAAAQSGRKSEKTSTRNAVIAPALQRATMPAPPNIPSPGAAVRPFSATSAFASSISCRTSSDRSLVSSLATSPIGRSRSSLSVLLRVAIAATSRRRTGPAPADRHSTPTGHPSRRDRHPHSRGSHARHDRTRVRETTHSPAGLATAARSCGGSRRSVAPTRPS